MWYECIACKRKRERKRGKETKNRKIEIKRKYKLEKRVLPEKVSYVIFI
jgi:hypothetical protein